MSEGMCKVKGCRSRGRAAYAATPKDQPPPQLVCESHYHAISWEQTMRVVEASSQDATLKVIDEVIEELGRCRPRESGGAS